MGVLNIFKLFGLILIFFKKDTSCEKSNIWAVLHVGWDDYNLSYGMEAAIYRMYNILVRNGIPRSQIITISPDSAAYHPQNPLPGVIVHATKGNPYVAENVYEGVVIDYNPKDLDIDLFFDIMNGNDLVTKNITGSGKVLKAGPNDHIFIYTTSLGMYGGLLFGPSTIFYANTFIPRLEELKDRKRFAKMLMFVDTDSPGSMFDDYLDSTKNILVYTVGGRYSVMHMIELNDLIKAYTATSSSNIFLRSLELLIDSRSESTVFDHHILARNEALIDLDPLNLYGALNLGKEKLSSFFGKSSNRNLNYRKEPMKSELHTVKLNQAFEESGTVSKTEIEMLQNKLKAIISNSLSDNSSYSIEEFEKMEPNLPLDKYDCYRSAFEAVQVSCFNEKNLVILLDYAKNFAKLCSFNIGNHKITQITRDICK